MLVILSERSESKDPHLKKGILRRYAPQNDRIISSINRSLIFNFQLSAALRMTFTSCSTKPHTGGSSHLS